MQFNAALITTGAIKGTSRTKLNKELGLETLKFRRWFRRLCTLFNIKTTGLTKYLFKFIPQENYSHNTHSVAFIRTYCCRTEFFKCSFFPHSVCEWNKLDITTRREKSLLSLRNSMLKLVSLQQIFNVHYPTGTRLRLGHSQLNSHRFYHNFSNCINPLCLCSLKFEWSSYFFLRCHYFTNIRSTLLDKIAKIDSNILSLPANETVEVLLYGN